MEIKKYYNRNLQRILNRSITKSKYGEWTDVLKEIMQRRAYEFEFSDKEMENQAKNLVKYLGRIRFATEKEMVEVIPEKLRGKSMTRTMAMYERSSESKEILINKNYFEKFIEVSSNDKKMERTEQNDIYCVMFKILTNEVYHAIEQRDDKCSGLEYNISNEIGGGRIVNEIFNEVATMRASFSKTREDIDRYRAETKGYSDVTFFANLLAASIGTTEKETLKAGIQDRKHLENLIEGRFSNRESQKNAKELFQICEAQMECLYNMSQAPELDDINIKKSVLTELYSKIYQMASLQIANSSEVVDSRYTASLLYRYSKIDRIIKDSMIDFGIGPMDKQEILSGCMKNKLLLYKQVNSIYELEKQSYKFPSAKTKADYMFLAKYGQLDGAHLHELSEHYGITIPERMELDVKDKTIDLTYYTYVIKEDYDFGRQWDNDKSSKMMKNVFERDKQRRLETVTGIGKTDKGAFSQIVGALKGMVARIKNGCLKKLPSAQTMNLLNIDEKTKNNNPWVVSHEDLRPLDVVRQEQSFYEKETGEEDRENE